MEEKYLEMTFNDRTKKDQGDTPSYVAESNIIMSQPGSRLCPVTSFELYLSKLSKNTDILFQQPNKNFNKDGRWYTGGAAGKNKMKVILKTICQNAGLSQVYTNHCLRGTTATVLREFGYSIPEIASVTKHKNHQSLEHYLAKPSVKQKASFCDSLFKYVAVEEEARNIAKANPLSKMTDGGSMSSLHTLGSPIDSDDSCFVDSEQESRKGELAIVEKTSDIQIASDTCSSSFDSEGKTRRKAAGLFVGAQISNCTFNISVSK